MDFKFTRAAIFIHLDVVCTSSEPMPGWIDNMYGPTGVMVGCGAGLIRTMQTSKDEQANLVPCDMAINALITSAWDAVENRKTSETPIYNYVSLKTNPITWKEYNHDCISYGKTNYPLAKAIWVPTLTHIADDTLYLIFRTFVHILPAFLMDLYLMATKRSPMMLKVYRKIHKFNLLVAYFGTKHWDFESKNVEAMWKRLDFKDQKLFSFDMNSLDWRMYIKRIIPGIRFNIAKDPIETLPAALAKQKRLAILHSLLKFLLNVTALWLSMQALSWSWSYLLSAVQHSWLQGKVYLTIKGPYSVDPKGSLFHCC